MKNKDYHITTIKIPNKSLAGVDLVALALGKKRSQVLADAVDFYLRRNIRAQRTGEKLMEMRKKLMDEQER